MSRISPTLAARGGKVCCVQCGHTLVGAGASWKQNAALTTVPLKTLPGASPGLHSDAVLRLFSCPQCLRLLDTETALPDDPFLEDVVTV